MPVRVVSKSVRRGKAAAKPQSAPARSTADLSKWPLHDLFEEYKRSRDERIRNYLLERFLPLVRYNAERIHTRLPDEVDVEDLVSAGVFGLKDAIENFDLSRKVKFETYCAPRIRGAILDELRSMDWVPRLVRHRTARVEAARQQIEMESGQPASDRQIAERIGISMEDFEKYKRDSVARNTRSLSARCFPSDGSRDVREIDVIRDETQVNPLVEMHRRDLRELITKGLSRAERLIIILYYYEGMTMKEIGATLDLSESRVSQMHSSVLLRLKAQMQHRSRELEPVE
jgi:RNA polymerase sigma factor for flagellar operon FliA